MRFWRFVLLFVVLFSFLALFTINPVLRFFFPIHYSQNIAAEAERYQLDPFFIAAIIQVESGFRPTVVSPKGATGLMQLMPTTASWIAQQMNMDFSEVDLRDPGVNIVLGTYYINHLLSKFPTLAASIASYNAGQGNVAEWLETNRWDGRVDTIRDIPFGETRTYLTRVFTTWDFFREIYQERFPRSERSKL